ncbi:MAG TPA: TolC family protein, partial [Tepidisphaeraceae bacterium]
MAASLLAVAGCTVGPDFKKPDPGITGGWAEPLGSSYATTRPTQFNGPEADLAEWWKRFNDPGLNAMVERAIEANLDVRRATSAVRQSRASRSIAAADLLPQADASGGYSRSGSPRTETRGLYR